MEAKKRNLFYIMFVPIVAASFFILLTAFSVESRSNISKTKSAMEFVYQAVEQFRIKNGRLPCPASQFAQKNDAMYGKELTSEAACSSQKGVSVIDTIYGGKIIVGAVPVKSLGLGEGYMFDGWDSRYLYVVTQKLAAKEVSQSAIGEIDIFEAHSDKQNPIASNISFIIMSSGEDRYGAYNRAGSLVIDCIYNIAEGENCDYLNPSKANNMFVDSVIINNARGNDKYFYDIIKWGERRITTAQVPSDKPFTSATPQDSFPSAAITIPDIDTDAGMRFLQVGDDSYLTDVDKENTLTIGGISTEEIGCLQMGMDVKKDGATMCGYRGRVHIGNKNLTKNGVTAGEYPRATLDVAGSIKVGNDYKNDKLMPIFCSEGQSGTIRFNKKDGNLELCSNKEWSVIATDKIQQQEEVASFVRPSIEHIINMQRGERDETEIQADFCMLGGMSIEGKGSCNLHHDTINNIWVLETVSGDKKSKTSCTAICN